MCVGEREKGGREAEIRMERGRVGSEASERASKQAPREAGKDGTGVTVF